MGPDDEHIDLAGDQIQGNMDLVGDQVHGSPGLGWRPSPVYLDLARD